MDLILMRHPPPEVAAALCYGRTDLPVDSTRFAATVESMRTRLTTLLDGRMLSALHSSPLRRARQTALALAATFDVPVAEDPRLAEMDFGAWEMRPWADIDRHALDAWARDVAGFSPPDGESARDVVLRMDAWASELRRGAAGSDAVHVAVAHAGPIRLHAATALRLPTTACLSWTLDFGAICHLHIADDGHARLIRWNA